MNRTKNVTKTDKNESCGRRYIA